MNHYIVLLLIIATLAILVISYIINSNKKYQDTKYLKNLSLVQKFFNEIKSFDDYITWKERDKILKKYKPQHDFFEGKSKFYSREPEIEKFNATYENFKAYIDMCNASYVDTTINKYNDFFNDIESKKLDRQQREAVVADEYSNLIVAGAGSGKTLTILGKVLFLTKIKKVQPKRILLMSYTRKTVDDLNERLKAIPSDVRATTFHKLGLGIIADYEGERPNVAGEELLKNTVKNYLQSEIANYPEQTQALIKFIACYANIPEDYNDFQSAGARFDFYKGSVDYETLKSKTHRAGGVKQTLSGERVRSVEELMIANFFYLNGIKYEYEKAYPYSSFAYHPDFYLPDYDIWLEHFGVDENNEAKWLNSYDSAKYAQEMMDKRRVHRENHTILLETYSYYNKQHRLLEELKTKLEKNGVELKRIDVGKVYDAISQDEYFGHQLQDLIISFVNLYKSRDVTENEVKKIFLSGYTDSFMAERAKLFFEFAFPIVQRYQKALDEDKSIDFHDMINRAADIVRKHGCPIKYDYIIVDEYQDISYSRFNLMMAIRESSDAKILCVGDDWQSIYRFAGSDISLFSEFGRFVGEYKQLLIERTFRNSQELVDIAANFIQKNPMQIEKHPKSDKHSGDPIVFIQYESDNYRSIYNVFVQQIKRILARYGNDSSIMILGRHSFDIDVLLYMENEKIRKRDNVKFSKETGKLTINGINCDNIFFSTAHKAKGLQADNVIVLHMENSQYGFPNKLTDDPMLAPLLSAQEDFRYAEERRLFYVALTRTKNEVILLSPNANESEFFTELLQDGQYILSESDGGSQQVNCPWCETGKLVIRRNGNTGEQFLGCSHYPQCNQSYKDIDILKHPMRCNRCGSGFLVKKKGRYGGFLGCTNWKPDNRGCSNTIKL